MDPGRQAAQGQVLKPEDTLPPSILVSATYDGEARKAVLKLYEPTSQHIYIYYDPTGHKPYCYSKSPPQELAHLKERPDILELRAETKLDLIQDRVIEVTKIVATDPLAIGGSPSTRSVRNVIEAWEADIKYYENYLYDQRLIPGTFYRVTGNRLEPVEYDIPEGLMASLKDALEKALEADREHILEWARILGQPLIDPLRAALDIEVAGPEPNRIPDPRETAYPVIAVAMVGSDGQKVVYLLAREGVATGERTLPQEVEVKIFRDEKELLSQVFEAMRRYPFIITFNGDDFDFRYLYHRAEKLGIARETIPITLGREEAYLKHGVHIDLYKTFVNRSIQAYAFSNQYSEHTLDGIAQSLLGEQKLVFEGLIGELPLHQLAAYCYHDAWITYRLTSFSDGLLMKLLLVISRVAKMPLDDVSRLSVSNWIRSMMYFEHRRRGALIPRSEELQAKGGATSKATIKGKKYKGGLVVEPSPGVHFNAVVLDFASLYPSIIKVYNLSYETVRCPHPECRSNRVPETNHWVCVKKRGITASLIGSLRDLRVHYYKPLSKKQDLSPAERDLFNVVAQALKVILNAAYGVMGAEIFPLYCLPVAEATAAYGRYAIGQTIKKCYELGIEVLYGDTDSLFLKAPPPEVIDEITRWAEAELGIELDLEKTYRFVAFSGRKKNYLGVLQDGTVDIKGLTGKKSHTPPFIKKAFYEAVQILSRVQSPDDFEKARDEIRRMVREKYLALKNREVPLEELAFNVMLGKALDKYEETEPQHVKAAKLLQKHRSQQIRAGDIISFVKTMSPPGVKPVELAKPEDIDNTKYFEYLESTFDQILDALGYEFDEIMGATKLEDFFWS
jgi:DNA polymerase I